MGSLMKITPGGDMTKNNKTKPQDEDRTALTRSHQGPDSGSYKFTNTLSLVLVYIVIKETLKRQDRIKLGSPAFAKINKSINK